MIFPSMCTVETFPHNGLSLQTNLTQDEHSPQTRHTIHHKPHTTHHTLMLSEREGGKGYYSGGQAKERYSSTVVPTKVRHLRRYVQYWQFLRVLLYQGIQHSRAQQELTTVQLY